MTPTTKKSLAPRQQEELLNTLEARFSAHMDRHPGLDWADVRATLVAHPDALWSLGEMERSGGEPDLIGGQGAKAQYLFVDCSPESPEGRRSLCYDGPALEARKKHKPGGSALEAAADMGVDLLDEEEYRHLQQFGPFDRKTSSWLRTPPEIRSLGGAMFGDYRFGTVWVYHNGADSYYASRGFRCALRIQTGAS